ncbi:histidine acid phosphatase-like protein [Xylona heveae TC161]|uniref:3-phytase n=1 Tax=Xylona heveae (strain CBS 132557 / TC161) TaxID=1328760 RepID=A0A161TPB9_XYLHT|nr:histidine acid phosphatase-like protein [Xylona heveae TC161]KZF24016.1 histidine acid phosphatase-like protein [Xylona heveae TC161]
MTTLQPRGPYTPEELKKLYPESLELQLVQILLRHGERSPVSTRFRNAGVPAFWPYCSVAKKLRSTNMTSNDGSSWNDLEWRRRLETFAEDDGAAVAAGPAGTFDAICQLGELTDRGRETTFALGQRLRHLYVEQLKFMPRLISDADMMYLRATPIPRALESVQQTFLGMYPSNARTASFPPPTILIRTPADETLFPNDGNCRRFSQLSRAFAERTARRWNETTEMDYLNKLISKWMPDHSSRVAVDSRPRLSGIMDTINSTLAHGPETRLPPEFYDEKGRKIIDRIGVEEWFSGYEESNEYRTVGIGALAGDIVARMTGNVEKNDFSSLLEIGDSSHAPGQGRGGEKLIKFALSGCHDTTLGSLLASLGAFEGGNWPPYSSHISFELFRSKSLDVSDIVPAVTEKNTSKGILGSIFGSSGKSDSDTLKSRTLTRKKLVDMSDAERSRLKGYFVRVRYNDHPVTIPGCRKPGSHLEGDESFCTLEAFKAIVDRFTPDQWKSACQSNLDKPSFPPMPEPAGY